MSSALDESPAAGQIMWCGCAKHGHLILLDGSGSEEFASQDFAIELIEDAAGCGELPREDARCARMEVIASELVFRRGDLDSLLRQRLDQYNQLKKRGETGGVDIHNFLFDHDPQSPYLSRSDQNRILEGYEASLNL